MNNIDQSPRKKWSKNFNEKSDLLVTPRRHERVPTAKQMEPPASYGEYLFLLEQRNQMLKKIKLTDKDQLEKERKEKGFALYVNGANAKLGKGGYRASPSPRVTSKSRLQSDLTHLERKAHDTPSPDLRIQLPDSRSRSAPEKAQKTYRKNWNASSINIQTTRGEKMHLRVPGENYSDDFEDPSVSDSVNSSNQNGCSSGSSSGDEATVRESLVPSNHHQASRPRQEPDNEETMRDQVVMSMDDLTRLRKSLEMSRSLRETITADMGDDSDIDEDIPTVSDSVDTQLSPKDVFVLEFAPIKKSPRRKATKTHKSSLAQKPLGLRSDKSFEFSHSKLTHRSSRPLSAVKKSASNCQTESVEQKTAVLSAVHHENLQVSEYMKKRNDKQKTEKEEPKVNSFMLDDDASIQEVEERVLQMEPQQQRDLMKTLHQLERTVRPSSTALISRTQQNQSSNGKDKELHKILLELISNWGHPKLVGLTEVMLLDECNKRIEVNTSFLQLDGAKNCRGQGSNIFNNRYKTVKERNMFCCEKSSHKPVSLSLRVEIPLGSQIHKIKVWNYNKSLNELDIGVRRLRVSIDNEVLYDGDVDKGCGNQVFDYGQTVVLGSDDGPSDHSDAEIESPLPDSKDKRLHAFGHDSVRKSNLGKSIEMWVPLSNTPEPTERCQTRIMARATTGVDAPRVDSDSDAGDTMVKNSAAQPKVPLANNHQPPSTRKNIDPNLTLTQKPPTIAGMGKMNSSKLDKGKAAKLPWMENLDLSKQVSQRSGSPSSVRKQEKDTENTSASLSLWLQESKTDPLVSSIDGMFEKLDMWETQDQRRSKPRSTLDPPTEIPTKVASESEEAHYRQQASRDMARRAPKNSKNDAARARRRKWQQGSVADLEASWTSLDLFARSQKGRLSMEGDALEEYLRSAGVSSETTQSATTHPVTSLLESISEDVDTDQFIIPELPRGQNLVINIKSTWGDKFYVGLNGIELFADTGEPISISKVTANPCDINVLAEYKNDPRVVSNLIDGVNRTRDDVHMWLAPFTEAGNHFICLTFTQPTAVALMRIWNYNKSRIHSFRGAKHVEVSLDGKYIFKGEIARACGGMQGGTEAFGDTILFTTSDEILDAVSRHDGQYEGGNFSDEWEDDVPLDARPSTADKGQSERPHTSAVSKSHKKFTAPAAGAEQQTDTALPVGVDGDTLVYQASKISLNFTETWGDVHYLGLTGLEVVDKAGESIPLNMSMLDASPRDLHVLPGYESDDRTLDKLIDGVNITMSDEHMWMVPYTEAGSHTLSITFSRPQELVGLRFWNYNKSTEDTYRGAKTVHVYLDNNPISPPHGFLIRKGPGNCYYDFAQELLFSDILRSVQLDQHASATSSSSSAMRDNSGDDYIMSGDMPRGFVYQFHLMSSLGDLYYLGLNAIEFFDAQGKRILLEENNLAAYPESVNVLDGITGDVRTPDKLITDSSGTVNNDNMWLAPVLPSITNRLYVIFDYPQTISMIKIWNYSKTPTRGVKDFALLVDDLLVYNGSLDTVKYGSGILPNTLGPQNYHTVLFTSDETITRRVRHTIVSNISKERDIQLTNDNQIVSKPSFEKLQKSADQALRPKTSVQKRGYGRLKR